MVHAFGVSGFLSYHFASAGCCWLVVSFFLIRFFHTSFFFFFFGDPMAFSAWFGDEVCMMAGLFVHFS
jgi:hypothetical protein